MVITPVKSPSLSLNPTHLVEIQGCLGLATKRTDLVLEQHNGRLGDALERVGSCVLVLRCLTGIDERLERG